MNEVSTLVGIAEEAAARAGRMISVATGPGNLVHKGGRDYASEVDIAVERDIRKFLSESAPEIGMLGEESGFRSSKGPMMWVVDPIDGTANFVHGLPLYGVSIALVADGETLIGVVELPAQQQRYVAVRGAGAARNGEPIHAASTQDLGSAMVAFADFAVEGDLETLNGPRLRLLERLASRVGRVRMLGAAVADLTMVADGRLDASFMLSNKPWDTAAGVLIAREAGAIVIDIDGSPHHYGSVATIAVASGLISQVLPLLFGARLPLPVKPPMRASTE
jgi:myo-inositol-1(or 4)-monophosphatase